MKIVTILSPQLYLILELRLPHQKSEKPNSLPIIMT